MCLHLPYNNHKQRGATVVEIALSIALIVVLATSVLELVSLSLQGITIRKQSVEATALAKEGIEAVRTVRNGTTWNTDGLGTLTMGAVYHVKHGNISPTSWALAAGSETIGDFTRTIVFDPVERDGNDNIVTTGGTVDPNTVEVMVTVTWSGGAHSLDLKTYLTNWKQ